MVDRATLTFEDWMRKTERRLRAVERRRNTRGGAGVPYAVAAGILTIASAAVGRTSYTVTTPVGRFTQAPVVQLTGQGTAPDTRSYSVGTRSATSFMVWVYATAAGGTTVHWTAHQMSSTSGVGRVNEEVDVEYGDVACPTDGCENQGVTISVPTQWVDDEGVVHDVDEIVCGVCGTVLSVLEAV